MEFTARYLNSVRRELERKPGEVENLRVLVEFLREKGILGSADTKKMVKVPPHIEEIVVALEGN